MLIQDSGFITNQLNMVTLKRRQDDHFLLPDLSSTYLDSLFCGSFLMIFLYLNPLGYYVQQQQPKP